MISSVPWWWMHFAVLHLYIVFVTFLHDFSLSLLSSPKMRTRKKTNFANNYNFCFAKRHIPHFNYFRHICMNFVALWQRLRLNIEHFTSSHIFSYSNARVCAYLPNFTHIIHGNDMYTMYTSSALHISNTCVRRNWEKFFFSFVCCAVHGLNCVIIDAAAEKCIEFIQSNEPEIAP